MINKKRVIWLASILFFLFVIIFTWTVFSFEESKKFNHFPIPKFAEVTNNREDFESYSAKWIGTSETKKDGLPFIYRLQIKTRGWEKTFQEGSLTTYEKDNHKIDVIAETNYLSIGISKD